MKKQTLLLIVLIFLCLITQYGCMSYTELNERYFVAGAALDFDEGKKKYVLTVEVVEPKASPEGSNLISRVYSSEGDTVFDATRNSIRVTGKKLYWSHAKVLIIHERLLQEDIGKVVDFFDRDPEVRSDMWILVSDKQSAGDVLRMKQDNTMFNGFNISTMLKNSTHLPKYVKEDLWDFMHELATEGYAPVASVVNLAKTDGKISPSIEGTAVFSKSIMVGKLNDTESIALNFIRNDIDGGLLVIPHPDSSNEGKLVIEIFHNTTKITPVYSDNSVTVNIDIKTKAGVGESQIKSNFTDPKTVKEIKKHSEMYIEKQISTLISKVQKEYKSDIFGFGAALNIHDPAAWKKLKNNWEENFSLLQITVKADVEFTDTGETIKTVK